MDYARLSAAEIAAAVSSGRLKAGDVLVAALERTRRVEPSIEAYLCLTETAARRVAAAVDAAVAAGQPVGPLAGVPVAVKDNMCTDFAATTCASKILEGYVPPYNATAVDRLRAAGAVIIGKTNMDEFAMGSSCENSAYKRTRNPWNTRRIPGGSSGGSAAAVAAGSVPLALGSDTGGSIRQPAALCGTVGLKPTYGLVSRWGLVAFGSSLDQIGVFSRTVADAALITQVIAGWDPRDSTSSRQPVPAFAAALKQPVAGLKVGLPREYFIPGMQKAVEEKVREAARLLERRGCRICEVSLPHTEYAIAVYYLVATAEASSNLARYDGVHYGYRSRDAGNVIDMYSQSRRNGFGPEVKRRIMLGTFALSAGYHDAYYKKALKVRRLIAGDFERAFEAVDLILAPTSPTTAFRLGEKVDDPLAMYLSDIFTISANLAAIPGLNVPCGFDDDCLPVGMQLMGPRFSEPLLFAAGHAYEQAAGLAPLVAEPRQAKGDEA